MEFFDENFVIMMSILTWTFKFSKFPKGGAPETPTGRGHPLPYPPPRATLPHGAAPRRITESGTIQFPPSSFYKNENPVFAIAKFIIVIPFCYNNKFFAYG